MKILIVDDSKIGRTVIKDILKDLKDVELHEATNGLEGLEAYKKEAFEIIISDIEMPEMDGIKMTEEIKAIESSYVKIIIVSSVVNKVVTHQALLKGASLVLQKPVDANTLLDAVNG